VARAAIVLSGSPLFNGGAASGESEIRRWLLEDDLIEAIVALPTDLFFRTNIATYLWILSNKPQERKSKVRLIDATDLWTSIRNGGNNVLSAMTAPPDSGHLRRMQKPGTLFPVRLDYRTFGYRRIKVLRPLRMTGLDKVGMERLEAEAAWEKLSDAHQTFWREALKPLIGQTQPYSWAETFVRDAIGSPPCWQSRPTITLLITALINAFVTKTESRASHGFQRRAGARHRFN
jgi:type I restriction enzyme M protein